MLIVSTVHTENWRNIYIWLWKNVACIGQKFKYSLLVRLYVTEFNKVRVKNTTTSFLPSKLLLLEIVMGSGLFFVILFFLVFVFVFCMEAHYCHKKIK